MSGTGQAPNPEAAVGEIRELLTAIGPDGVPRMLLRTADVREILERHGLWE